MGKVQENAWQTRQHNTRAEENSIPTSIMQKCEEAEVSLAE